MVNSSNKYQELSVDFSGITIFNDDSKHDASFFG